MDLQARAPLLVFFTAILLAVGVAGYRVLGGPSLRAQIEEVRGELGELRGEVQLCRRELVLDEAEFRDFDGEVTALRTRVRGLESLHPEGVPADSYPAYLEVLELYNEAVPEWSRRADSLQGAWERCTALIQAHNHLSDSLRTLLEEAGLIQPVERLPPGEE